MLVKRGYGSIAEVEDLDTRDFLNAIEFENIISDIERYHMQKTER